MSLGRREINIYKNLIELDHLYVGEGMVISTNGLNGTKFYMESSLELRLHFSSAISSVYKGNGIYLFQGQNYRMYAYELSNNITSINIEFERFLTNGLRTNQGLVLIEYKSIDSQPLEWLISCYSTDFEKKWSIKNPYRSRLLYGETLDGLYYILDSRSNLKAIFLEDGTESWSISNKDWPMEQKPETSKKLIVYNDTLIVFNDYAIFGLEAKSGSIKWKHDTKYAWGAVTSEGVLHYVTYKKPLRLISIDVETGAVLESKDVFFTYSDKAPQPDRGPTSFQLNKDTLWVGWPERLGAIDLKTGEMFFNFMTDYNLDANIVVSNNRVYFTTTNLDVKNFQHSYFVIEGEGGYIPD